MKQVRAESDLTEARADLLKIEADSAFITRSSYSANTSLWPDNRISFIDIHLAYLKSHPQVSVKNYISNLRLRLRKIPTRR